MDTITKIADYRELASAFDHVGEEPESIWAQLNHLMEIEGSLIAIERESATPLYRQIAELTMCIKLGISERLPIKPLRSRNPLGQPNFAVYNSESSVPVFSISRAHEWGEVTSNHRWSVFVYKGISFSHGISAIVADQFLDIREHLDERLERWYGHANNTITLSTTFRGLMPVDIRKKIAEASKTKLYINGANTPLFEKILLISEVEQDKWSYDMAPAPYIADPLVVGVAYGGLYLIGHFDPTPAEHLWMDKSTPTG